jgi:predicted nucleic acid-binding protein
VPVVVVSDSSPIRALHHLGLLSICRTLYGTVVVPEAVRGELRHPTATCPSLEITDHAGFEVRIPRSKPADLGVPFDLDPGETEAIVLALEMHADLVLMDERKGTEAARRLGLATIGVFGVLLEAKRGGLIDRVLPCVDRLVLELRFFVSPALRLRLAQLASE